MGRTSPDFQQKKSLEIKPEDKFVRKLLNRDGSVSVSDNTSSFRVYYGDLSGSVPFLWETSPGTPKHPSLDTSIPPLTPPPSYYFKANPSRRPSRSSRLLQILFSGTKSAVVKSSTSESPMSSSSSSSSSLWSCSMSPRRIPGQSRLSSPGSSFDSQADHRDVEEEAVGSPKSTLCFAIGRSKHRGCHAW